MRDVLLLRASSPQAMRSIAGGAGEQAPPQKKKIKMGNNVWHERDVIAAVASVFHEHRDICDLGIGDDCAVLRRAPRYVTTDACVEGVHFDLGLMSMADAAYRCLTSNISDVAAMGAEPGPFTLALGLPPSVPMSEICLAIGALRDSIAEHDLASCWLVGGDVVRSDVIFFSVTMWGEAMAWPCVRRDGAREGDVLLALGGLGHAAAGLDALRAGYRADGELSAGLRRCIRAFLRPRAQVGLAQTLAQKGLLRAMMDLSDGLMADLPKLLARSECGGRIEIDALVADEALQEAALTLGVDPIDWMLSGGEDFSLLVAVLPDHVATIRDLAYGQGVSCHQLGTCCREAGVHWTRRSEPVIPCDKSFSHF